jgi:hypothetical protein
MSFIVCLLVAISRFVIAEQSDEPILNFFAALDCFAKLVIGPAISGRTRWLAMTR